MNEPKVKVRDVSMAFGDNTVVDDVSIEVGNREFVSIVGTSGGGKTTLLRAMAGLIEPRSGEILLDGEPITQPTPRIAMVFQHFGLFPWKTVRQNLCYGLKVQGREDTDGRIERLLEMMRLADFDDHYPFQLSGGMKQRVGIARALAVRPEVLLMDEPFSAVDALTREELQNEVLQLWERNENTTAILVTHDIDEAILLSDRIVVLYGQPGRLVCEVKIGIARPRDSREIRFHEEYPRLRRRLWDALQGQPADEGASPQSRKEAV